jgi:hypothetical protein
MGIALSFSVGQRGLIQRQTETTRQDWSQITVLLDEKARLRLGTAVASRRSIRDSQRRRERKTRRSGPSWHMSDSGPAPQPDAAQRVFSGER